MSSLRRGMVALIAVLAASTAGAGAPSTATASDYWRDCGDRIVGEALIVSTKAHAVSCKIARKVGKRYASEGDRHPLGFDCSKPEPDRSGEVQKGACTREGARVRVVFGI
jgi:hypothetical protein